MKKYFFIILISLIEIFQSSVLTAQDRAWRKAYKKYQKGEYVKSISITTHAIQSMTRKKNTDFFSLSKIYALQALSAQAKTDFRIYQESLTQALDCLSKIYSNDSIAYAIGLLDIADVYLKFGDAISARTLLQQTERVFYSSSEKVSEDYRLKLLISFSRAAILQQNYSEARAKFQEAITFFKTKKYLDDTGKLHFSNQKKDFIKNIKKQYAELCVIDALILVGKGNIFQADSSIKTATVYIRKAFGKNNELYRELVFGQSVLLSQLENYGQARDVLLKLKKQLSRKHLGRSQFSMQVYQHLLKTNLDLLDARRFKQIARDFKNMIVRFYGTQSMYYAMCKSLTLQYDFIVRPSTWTKDNYEDILMKEQSLPAYHPNRIEVLRAVIEQAQHVGDLFTCEKYYSQLLTASKKLYGDSSCAYHSAYLEYANYLVDYSSDFRKSNTIYEKSFYKSVSHELSSFHPFYIYTLSHIAHFYELTDQLPFAEKTIEEVKVSLIKKYNSTGVTFATYLIDIAAIEIELGNYQKAENTIEQALHILKGVDNKNYYKALATQARYFLSMNFLEEAEKNLNKCIRYYEKQKLDFEKSSVMDDVSTLLLAFGRYNQTEKFLNYSLETKSMYGENHRFLIDPLNKLADFQLIKGNYPEAEKSAERAYTISKTAFGESSRRTASCLMQMADIATALGNYNKAEHLLKNIVETETAVLGDRHVGVAHALIQLATNYIYQTKNLNLADSLLKKSKQIIEASIGNQNMPYADVLVGLSKVYIATNQFDKALQQLEEAKSILMQKLGKEYSSQAADVILLMADVYMKQRRLEEADHAYQRSKKIYEKLFNVQHPKVATIQTRLAHLYYVSGKYDIAQSYSKQAIANYIHYIDVYFPSLSDREKTKFWNVLKQEFEFYGSLALKNNVNDSGLAEDIYNYSVLQKALLLNSALKVKEHILHAGDQNLKAKYSEWLTKKEYIGTLASLSEDEIKASNINLEQLDQQLEKLEKELNEKSEVFKNSYENIKIDWKKIQASLKEDEAAVEISRFPYFDGLFTDSIIYGVYIVKPHQKKPEIIFIYNGRELEQKYSKWYKNSIAYSLVDTISYTYFWKPLDQALKNFSTIYFSPDGIYNQINPETLSEHSGSFLIDKKNIVFVKSTKDIYLKKVTKSTASSTEKNIVIFGNPEFYTSASSTDKKTIKQLPGTELETNELKTIMQANGWHSNLFLFKEATEENVKSIQNPTVIHIATHGLFMEEMDIQNEFNDIVLFQNPMLRSGLLLKGAGDLMNQSETIYNLNKADGILTAYEAMNLNCDHTELVVLSSCESALGDIKSGEGVYGLQRAFLGAGAKSLIISLFKISDTVTKDFMILFYKKWLETGKKRYAFLEAKREIRTKYPDPLYWGAFIMVGLE